MEFTVSKSDLVRELGLSQGVVERKTTIPILSNVLLEASGDRLNLTATDLELGFRCSTPARVKHPGSGTLPAKKLMDYVRLLPDSDLTVKVADNHWASITCGRSKTRIAGMSRESFPELPQMPEPMAKIPAGLLLSLIGKTIFSIATEESRFTLNGALLQMKNGMVSMVSTDGHRLALAEAKNPLASEDLTYKALLPHKAMSELTKLCQDVSDKSTPVEFAGDDNHLFFRFGDRLLMSRKLTGNFPDYERVLPKGHEHHVELARDEFKSSLERVAQFSDERSRAVKTRFEDGEATLYSFVPDAGESEESLGVDYKGPKVEIGFNALYLLEFLRVLPEDKVRFYFKDGQSAGELRPVSGSDDSSYRYVVMPMRI